MTPKQIMNLDITSRLALSARARAGEEESVKDYVLMSAWSALQLSKEQSPKEKVRAFMEICRIVRIKVEPS